MKVRKLLAPLGAVVCMLAGCGSEIEVGSADEGTEIVQGAASTARGDFGPTSPADGCDWGYIKGVTAGQNAAGQRYLQYKPPVGGDQLAVLRCPMAPMYSWLPWDTAMLTRLTYEYVGIDKGALVCRIMVKQNGAIAGMSTPVRSIYGSTASVWTYWIMTSQPSAYNYNIHCYLPAGIKFWSYSYAYFDQI
jgi:hypothetical protein